MILIRKSLLYAVVLLTSLLVGYFTVLCFSFMGGHEQGVSFGAKYQIENMIFVAILFIAMIHILFLYIIQRSQNVLKELDKVVELSEYGSKSVIDYLSRLGDLGVRVKYLLHHLNELNEKKTLKISSLANINAFLVQHTKEMLVLLSHDGKILYASNYFFDAFKVERLQIVGKLLCDYCPHVEFSDILREVEKNFSTYENPDVLININNTSKKLAGIFCPIINAQNRISHIVAVFEQK